jgi:hypothetical protein
MLAAEIRYRATGDGSFLLPTGQTVKGIPTSPAPSNTWGPARGEFAHATSDHRRFAADPVLTKQGRKNDDQGG